MENIMLFSVLILPFLGSFAGYLLGKKSEKCRNLFYIIISGAILILLVMLYRYVYAEAIDISIRHIMGTGLHLRLDLFRYVFLLLASFLWFLALLYSLKYLIGYKNRNRNRYYFYFMLTLGSTIGFFISENLLNLFTFFEVMSFTSYVLIIHDEDDYSHDAGNTYMVTAIIGGLTLLMGLFLLYNYTQTLDISLLHEAVKDMGSIKYVISALMIIGFGVKAGMIPLHTWLPKAHPAAPAPASAVLSGVLLKAGIFGIILTADIMLKEDFYVSMVIFCAGLINMFLGGLLAMLQRNIKRILAYSSISQIGYILVGVGLTGILKEHNAIAVYGTLFHIINHGIFKVMLFMSAGIIYMVLHELSINEIGGFGRNKNILKAVFLIGMFAITGMPGFNGYVSKTLIHHALTEAYHIYHNFIFKAAEMVFILSSSFTTAYLLKIFMAVFVDKGKRDYKGVAYNASKIIYLPLITLCVAIIYIGIWPKDILYLIGGAAKTFGVKEIEVHFYAMKSVLDSLLINFLGGAIYFLFVRKLLREGEGNFKYYINPALNWFSIERDFYIPAGKILFFLGSHVFKFIDDAILNLALFFVKAFHALKKLNEESLKNYIHMIKERSYTYFEGMKPKAIALARKLNGITSSVYIFAYVLVLFLLILIIF
ncbi:hydrogenase-4 component B [Oxobacter pfennigii]|uniref:Hydrogenase-4 component B n=1 Tax=Oxobacter pfennigii TaxID=36849 RepID=A0A0P8WVM4_9CLOT|nr:proton-conducting transporter membrane subunit [Oxobacter pfennigii]KPU42299.1 hydrogenase-4 component B [Oxobacter pfennigii]